MASTGTAERTGGTTSAHAALIGVLLVACALVLSRNHADPDFWGHVQYGRDALRDGLPLTATYTYTGLAFPWINHENLAELVFAWTVDHGGPSVLLWMKSIAGGLLMAGILVRGMRRRVRGMVLVAWVLLTALNLMFFWSLRPQLFSYIYFALLVMTLDRAFADWRRADGSSAAYHDRVLWWGVPLLIGLWANTHGGFVLGLFFLFAYLGLRGIESIARWGSAGCRRVPMLAAVAGLALAASVVNPYGWGLHAWLTRALGSPRPEILEWRPPELFSIVWWQWWLLVAASVAAFASSRVRRGPVHGLLLAAVLWQSIAHQRHIPFFAILFALWGLPHVDSAWRRFAATDGDPPLGAGWTRRARFAATGVALLFGMAISAGLVAQNRAIPVPRDGYPVSAFAFIAEHGLHGRLVARFKWAQYALMAFGPLDDDRAMRLAFDGRFRTCYPQKVVDMYFDFAIGDDEPGMRYRDLGAPPVDPNRILVEGRPDLVLIDRSQTRPARVLRGNADDWVLLYADSIAELWGRRSIYDDPRSPHYMDPAARRVGDGLQVGTVPWPALPDRTRSETGNRLAAPRSADSPADPSNT